MSRLPLISNIIKKIKRNYILSLILNNIIYLYLRLLFLTYRLEVDDDNQFEKNFNLNKGVFYFWHQNIIAVSLFFFNRKIVGHCIISSSVDGKIMGFIAKKLGFKVIYGSKYKKSIRLIRQALEVLEVNRRIALVGDGSRGPAFKLQRGVVYLASKSNLPLVFIECKADWEFTFKKSWDKFKLPLPFSKIYIKVHSPVIPSVDAYKDF